MIMEGRRDEDWKKSLSRVTKSIEKISSEKKS